MSQAIVCRQMHRIIQVKDFISEANLCFVEWTYPSGTSLEEKLAKLQQSMYSLIERIRRDGTEIPESLRETP